MIKPEVLAYLQANLSHYPLGDLRRQLEAEGISPADFNDSFKAALRPAATVPPRCDIPSRLSLALLAVGVLVVMGVAVFIAQWCKAPSMPGTISSAPGESAFMGRTGYVIHLPKGYVAVASFKDPQKTVEIVHFCQAGIDPTNFLHEGLFGPLGIVRLEVRSNPFAANATGQERLSQAISAQHSARGDKFTIKAIQVSSLRGIQVQVELPQPYLEAYILGETALYRFFAGQDDENFRDILNSLREPTTEAL